ncbi:hypothetical protein PFISCL1PPCAC_25381, partial [Pristionchus fissidentatus]
NGGRVTDEYGGKLRRGPFRLSAIPVRTVVQSDEEVDIEKHHVAIEHSVLLNFPREDLDVGRELFALKYSGPVSGHAEVSDR